MKYDEFKNTAKFDEFKAEYNKLIESMEKGGRDYREVNKDIVKLRKSYGIED